MGRVAVLGVLMAASLAALFASPGRPSGPALANQSYSYRILNNPTTGDAFGLRAAIQQTAQADGNKLYSSLASLLGGDAPAFNFVPTDSPLLTNEGDASANVAAESGAPQGTINMDPLAVEALANSRSPYHDAGVHLYPHEAAHLHQTPQTLADLISREGGAEAFANTVTATAAKRAGIPFHGNFNTIYGPEAQQAAAKGRGWILGQQFGRIAPPAWP